LKDLGIKAKRVLLGNNLGKSTKPAPKQYPHQWNWDSAFIALGVSNYDAERAGDEIISLLGGQWNNGMIPHIIYSDNEEYFPDQKRWDIHRTKKAPANVDTSGITQPPMITIAAHKIVEKLGAGFGQEVYQKLLSYHRWLYRERDPNNEGLVSIIHPWESGIDNSPRWIGTLDKIILTTKPKYERKDQKHVAGEERPTNVEYDRFVYLMDLARDFDYDQKQILANSPFVVQDVLFNSILHKANECLREIAVKIGKHKSDIDEIDNWMKTTRLAFKHKLWDSQTNMHCDYDLRNNNKICENSIAIFGPLYAGLVDEGDAQLIAQHLNDVNKYAPSLGSTKYYIPTTSKNSKHFNPKRYWLGPIWVNTNWMVIRGLERYGFTDLADRIRKDTLTLLEKGGFCEYFNPYTGKGHGTKRFSWSAALAIDLLSDSTK